MKGAYGIYMPKDPPDEHDDEFDFDWYPVDDGEDVPPLWPGRRINLLKKPKCDCGAEKVKTTHADWCSTRRNQ